MSGFRVNISGGRKSRVQVSGRVIIVRSVQVSGFRVNMSGGRRIQVSRVQVSGRVFIVRSVQVSGFRVNTGEQSSCERQSPPESLRLPNRLVYCHFG